MASIVVAGDTSGTVTLTAPAVSGTTTLTLPTTSGTVLTSASTITPSAGTVTQASLSTNVTGNGPAFSAYVGSSQTISSATTTKLQLNTEEFDTNNNFDSTTNYRFTPTVAGYYQFSGQVAYLSTTSSELEVLLFKNGSAVKRGTRFTISGQPAYVTISVLIYANGSTDYFELYTFTAGSSVGLEIASFANYFQAFLARAA
jgi:hypothetical protein